MRLESTMNRILGIGLLGIAACGSGSRTPATTAVAAAPAPVHTVRPYSRIPAEIGAFKLTERAVVRGAPRDSIYRYKDGSPTLLSVIIYNISESSKVDADSLKWTAREGALFAQVEEIQRQRGVLTGYQVVFSDSTRFRVGPRLLLEHQIAAAVRFANGRVAVELQNLYLIDGKYVKIRATVPAEGWEHNEAMGFGRKLAIIVAQEP